MRCGSDLIAEGYLKVQVLKSCGEPDFKEDIGFKTYKTTRFKKELKLEEWIYERYSEYFRIIFEGNKVIKIESIKK